MNLYPLLLVSLILSACAHTPAGRKIASIDENFQNEISRRYEVQEGLKLLEAKKVEIETTAMTKASNAQEAFRLKKEELAKLEKIENSYRRELDELKAESRERNKSFGTNLPEFYRGNLALRSRKAEDTINLKDWDKYLATPGHYIKYPLDIHSAKEYRLKIAQYFDTSYAIMNNDQRYVWAEVSCEGPYKLKTTFINHSYKAGEKNRFRFYNAKKNLQRITLTMTADSGECQMSFESKERSTHGITFVPEERIVDPNLLPYENQFEYCLLPEANMGNDVQKLFTTASFESMTCPQSTDEIIPLDNPKDGFRKKMSTMLGQDLPKNMLETMDPYYPLDFSKAPKLDAIYISYLVWRRDFCGTVMERLVRHHAEQGAQIKILVSEVISLDKDRKMLQTLAEDFPNVQVRFYQYDVSNNKNFADFFSEFHRTMHVKMLLTHSSENDDENMVVLGGRNIHDGFVFDKQPDLSRYPDLVQYGQDETFAKWTDFEILAKDRQMVETLMGQYLALFEYDQSELNFRSYTMTERATRPLDPGYFKEHQNQMLYRHFISVPYRDDMALEKYMVTLFDSAKSSITISTPYFNLTKELTAAIDRAISRGVKIEVITRLDFKGDTADIVLSDVNKKAVNRFVENITVHEFTKPSDILHSKLVLIDGELTTVGSVNFNQRSFYHDVENTLIVYSPTFNKKIDKVLDSYKVNTRKISTEQKTSLWKSLVIGIFNRAL